MKMWGIRAAVALASAASLVALPLTGCSTSTSAAPSTTATKVSVAAAPSTSSTSRTTPTSSKAAVDTARTGVRLTAKVGDTISGLQLGKQLERAMRGKSFHQTMKSGGAAVTADALVSNSAAGVAQMRITEEVAGEKVEVIYTRGVMYVSIPSESPQWVVIRPDGKDALSKQLAPLMIQMKQSMSGDIGTAGNVVWKVVAAGPTQVTYRAHVSAAQLRAQLGKSGLGAAIASKVPATGEDITEVVSRSGLPISTAISASGKTTSIHYTDWGPAVDIKAPTDIVTPPAA